MVVLVMDGVGRAPARGAFAVLARFRTARVLGERRAGAMRRRRGRARRAVVAAER